MELVLAMEEEGEVGCNTVAEAHQPCERKVHFPWRQSRVFTTGTREGWEKMCNVGRKIVKKLIAKSWLMRRSESKRISASDADKKGSGGFEI